MRKLFATGDKGIIEEINLRALSHPMKLNLSANEGFYKHRAFRVRASILEHRYGLQAREEKLQEFLSTIKSRKTRSKVEKSAKKSEERALSGRLKGYKTQMVNGAMLAMIMDGVWSKELADLHDIVREDVDHYYTTQMYIWIFLNNEIEAGFLEYLKEKAIEAYRVETTKVKQYEEGLKGDADKLGVGLRSLLSAGKFKRDNNPPRLTIEKTLYGKNELGVSKLEGLRNNLRAYTEITDEKKDRNWFHYSESITQYKYRKETKRLGREIKSIQKRNANLHKKLFLDNESNANITYIKSIGLNDLKKACSKGINANKLNWKRFNSTDKSIEEYTEELSIKYNDSKLTEDEKLVFKPTNPILENTKIKVTSVGQGKALVKEYVRWYNELYQLEIVEAKEVENKRQTTARNDQRRAKSRLVKKERDEQVIFLLRSGETNKAQIARVLDVKPRTVREIVDRFEAIEDLFNRGVTIPEAISEQTGTKLPTVIHYIEIITTEQVVPSVLTTEQNETLEAQREEEERALELMRVAEIKRIERERKQKNKEIMTKEVLRLHNRRCNPTFINKQINLSTTEIVNILKEMNLTPVFDYNLASDEEIKARKVERFKKLQEDGKNSPKIKF